MSVLGCGVSLVSLVCVLPACAICMFREVARAAGRPSSCCRRASDGDAAAAGPGLPGARPASAAFRYMLREMARAAAHSLSCCRRALDGGAAAAFCLRMLSLSQPCGVCAARSKSIMTARRGSGHHSTLGRRTSVWCARLPLRARLVLLVVGWLRGPVPDDGVGVRVVRRRG